MTDFADTERVLASLTAPPASDKIAEIEAEIRGIEDNIGAVEKTIETFDDLDDEAMIAALRAKCAKLADSRISAKVRLRKERKRAAEPPTARIKALVNAFIGDVGATLRARADDLVEALAAVPPEAMRARLAAEVAAVLGVAPADEPLETAEEYIESMREQHRAVYRPPTPKFGEN